MKTGIYKTVFADIWEQEWFLDLPLDEKIVFLNLMTSRYNRQIGVYLPVARFQAMQCGISTEQFGAIVDGFVQRGLLKRSPITGEIAIPSYLIEHFGKGGEPAKKLLENEAGSIKDQVFLQKVLQKNLDDAKRRRDLSVNKTLLDFIDNYLASSVCYTPAVDGEPVDTPTKVYEENEATAPLAAGRKEEKSLPDAPRTALNYHPVSRSGSGDKQITEDSDQTIYSLFQNGKYKDDRMSYLDIAREDPDYARWWAEKDDVRNPYIQDLFKCALLQVENEQPIQEYQIQKFKNEYPKQYQNESSIRELSRFTRGEAEKLLAFLWACNDMNWTFVDEIPEADYFVTHWNEMREEGLRNGYPLYNYIPF